MKFCVNILAPFVLVTVFLFSPLSLFAQIASTTEEETVIPQEISAVQQYASSSEEDLSDSVLVDNEVAPEVVVLPDEAQTVQQSASSTEILQETVNQQESVDPSTVEEDVVVELASTTEDVLETEEESQITEATSTQDVDETLLEPVQEEPEQQVPPETDVVSPEVPIVEESQSLAENEVVPVEIKQVHVSVEEFIPEPEYIFSVKTGKNLSTKRISKRTELRGGKVMISEVTEEISALPSITTDNQSGVMHISGTCEDAYYVVLVYRGQEDYERDRSSYILNRAYECVNNTFTYSVDQLPPTLVNGTYYILIGKQGQTGTWSPISGLTEIEITRNQN